MTPQERRNIRLKNDFKQMNNLRRGNNIISWVVKAGIEPYVTKYEITINIRSIVGVRLGRPDFRNTHIVSLTLPVNYPNSPPQTRMQSGSQPHHPNWYTNGNFCHGQWSMTEGLGEYIVRMIKTIQFDKDITNVNSAANSSANDWYKLKVGSNIFPCDNTVLPDPTVGWGEENSSPKKFTINKE